jgi:hypothetical protein
MAFTANDYIVDAADVYGDTAYERISVATWIKYLNAGIRALILVRPDAGAVTESVTLSPGVRQTVAADVLRLLDITRNMGTDGATAGKVITPSDRKHIDYSNLLWPAGTGDTAIDNFSYDKENPLVYYVTPPVHATTVVKVEAVFSKLPTAVTATSSSTGTNQVFFEPLVMYMLYKAFITDDEDVEFSKGMTFLQNFFNLLQVDMAAATAAGPETKE